MGFFFSDVFLRYFESTPEYVKDLAALRDYLQSVRDDGRRFVRKIRFAKAGLLAWGISLFSMIAWVSCLDLARSLFLLPITACWLLIYTRAFLMTISSGIVSVWKTKFRSLSMPACCNVNAFFRLKPDTPDTNIRNIKVFRSSRNAKG